MGLAGSECSSDQGRAWGVCGLQDTQVFWGRSMDRGKRRCSTTYKMDRRRQPLEGTWATEREKPGGCTVTEMKGSEGFMETVVQIRTKCYSLLT